jgi:hypothetical protein
MVRHHYHQISQAQLEAGCPSKCRPFNTVTIGVNRCIPHHRLAGGVCTKAILTTSVWKRRKVALSFSTEATPLPLSLIKGGKRPRKLASSEGISTGGNSRVTTADCSETGVQSTRER